jgi:arginyl-tRNA synthetase
LRKAAGQGIARIDWRPEAGLRLNTAEDVRLIKALASYPEVVRASALALAPHRIAFYLMELASQFHAYYNKHRVLGEDAELTHGRLCLVLAVKNVIRNGLNLLGVGAPDQM